MEQIKIFTLGVDHEFDELENKVNKWFEENKKVEVTSRHLIGTSGINIMNEPFVNLTIVIFYKNKVS